MGHFFTNDMVGGDGKLAAERYLGDNGKPLTFSAKAIKELRNRNAKLVLE